MKLLEVERGHVPH